MRRLRFRHLLVAAVALVLLTGAACTSEASLTGTEDVPVDAPWGDGEEAHYILKNDEGRELGTGTLRVERDGDTYRLSQEYRSPTDTDQLTSVVRVEDMKPVSFERKASRDGDVRGVEATYTETQVLATFTGGGSRDRTRDRPEHAYDNESFLFVWRAMPLEDDFAARVVGVAFDVLGRSIVTPVATVRVVHQETVEVPAGTFEAWRVEALTGGNTVVAWIAVDAPHHLVKYDSGRDVVYELTRITTEE